MIIGKLKAGLIMGAAIGGYAARRVFGTRLGEAYIRDKRINYLARKQLSNINKEEFKSIKNGKVS